MHVFEPKVESIHRFVILIRSSDKNVVRAPKKEPIAYQDAPM